MAVFLVLLACPVSVCAQAGSGNGRVRSGGDQSVTGVVDAFVREHPDTFVAAFAALALGALAAGGMLADNRRLKEIRLELLRSEEALKRQTSGQQVLLGISRSVQGITKASDLQDVVQAIRKQ